MQILNDARPWWGTLRGQLRIADLIASATLSPEAAAVLHWTIDHGASVFVAAGPPGAGKSTLANALLEFLPDDANAYVTAGGWDRLEIPPAAKGPTYLLVNELSAHMPVYLYGDAAQRAFALLDGGLRMLGTLHARSVAEAVRVMCYESEVHADEITTPFVFAVMSAAWNGPRIVRRVVEIGFRSPTGELTPLTTSDAEHLDPAGLHALATWSALSASEIQQAIAERAGALAATPSLR